MLGLEKVRSRRESSYGGEGYVSEGRVGVGEREYDGRVMDGCIGVSQRGLESERFIQSLNLEGV